MDLSAYRLLGFSLCRQDYIPWLLDLRKKKRLHPTVEEKLVGVLKQVAPDFHPVQEPLGLPGGRNDLLLFEFTGRKILFEIFASASQVSRDLRILDKTKADYKIAVLIDKDADPTVADHYFKENPEDNYPYIFIGELFEEPPVECVLKLRQLIFKDEEALFQRILRTKSRHARFSDQMPGIWGGYPFAGGCENRKYYVHQGILNCSGCQVA